MSLHTKYRPGEFEDVLGQQHVTKPLQAVVKANRARSFIFTGPSGCGKTTLARILANKFAGDDLNVTNIEELDAATYSGADAIRAIVARSRSRAIGASPVKAVIIDEAHALSPNAWKVLLKPIEEPPDHVYWMLCTTEASKIPRTIQTRCQRYDLKEVNEENILRLLVKVCDAERFKCGDDILEAIAENCGGSPRQALVYLEACLFCENADDARRVMRTAGQTKEVVDLCRWLVAGRGQSWRDAVKFVKSLEGTEAESIRIQVVNYLGSVLLNTKDDKRAAGLLSVLECFKQPYNSSDKMAPLLYSLGIALRLDQ